MIVRVNKKQTLGKLKNLTLYSIENLVALISQ